MVSMMSDFLSNKKNTIKSIRILKSGVFKAGVSQP